MTSVRTPAHVGLFFSDWADHLAGRAHEHQACAPDDLVAAAPHPPTAELSCRLLRAQSERHAASMVHSATTSWYLDELHRWDVPVVFGAQSTTTTTTTSTTPTTTSSATPSCCTSSRSLSTWPRWCRRLPHQLRAGTSPLFRDFLVLSHHLSASEGCCPHCRYAATLSPAAAADLDIPLGPNDIMAELPTDSWSHFWSCTHVQCFKTACRSPRSTSSYVLAMDPLSALQLLVAA